jgi:hypothetical protein
MNTPEVNEEQASGRQRPQITIVPYLTGVVAAVVLTFALYVFENYLEIDGAGRQMKNRAAPMEIWVPVATIPVATIVAVLMYRQHSYIVRKGIDVQAVVTGISRFETKGLRNISFRYYVGTMARTKRKSIVAIVADEMSVGDTIDLIVLPTDIDRYYMLPIRRPTDNEIT